MRRADREITDSEELRELIADCDTIYLGLMDGDYPYVVPLNFGVTEEDGKPVFYMHSAMEGKKLSLIQANPHACFCLTVEHGIQKGGIGCTWSYRYESVMGQGTVTLVESREEKLRAMNCLFHHYAGAAVESGIPAAAMDGVAIIRLEAESLTGKKRL